MKHTGPIKALQFNPSRPLLATAGAKGEVLLFSFHRKAKADWGSSTYRISTMFKIHSGWAIPLPGRMTSIASIGIRKYRTYSPLEVVEAL